MGDDVVARALLDRRDRLLEARVLERLDLPAAVADEVMVVPEPVAHRLEARDAVAHVHPLHEAVLGERLEHAVHAREADRAERVVDLLRTDAARLRVEVVDHGRAGGADATAASPEAGARRGRPLGSHVAIIDENRYRLTPMRIVLAFGCVLLLAACGGSGDGDTAGKRSVVAAFYPLAWAAEQVGGSTVDVQNLTPPGSEPHDVELTPRDVEGIQKADVVLYLSHGFQPAVEHAVDGARGEVVDAFAGERLREGSGDDGGEADPHVWLDPVRFSRVVRGVGAALRRPQRAALVAAEVRALDRRYRDGLAHCARRELVTSHAAFGYLAARYGLKQVPITGVDPGSEPSPRALADLVDTVRRDHVRTVFFEKLVSPRLAETVAREAGANTAVLDPLEGLTQDELDRGEDYVSVMTRNLRVLRQALGCR